MSYFTKEQDNVLKIILEKSKKDSEMKNLIENNKLIESLEKSNYMGNIERDVIATAYNMNVKLTEKQIQMSADHIAGNYNYADYNNYTQEVINLYKNRS